MYLFFFVVCVVFTMAAAGVGAVGDRVGGLVKERFKAFLSDYRFEVAAGESSQGQAEEVLVRGRDLGGAPGVAQRACGQPATRLPSLPRASIPAALRKRLARRFHDARCRARPLRRAGAP